MPLTPAVNYSQVYISAVIGSAVAITLGLISRNTLPFVGDLQHSLPHGGRYRDGTKVIDYFKPGKLNSFESRNSFKSQPWLLVILLIALIIGLSRRTNACPTCGRQH
uniref:Movement protein TGB2 n=1 Tax=Kalanchoe latent virus TaxID=132477 RepID=Q9ICX1_9VIRU|nr:hypothetical protein, 12K [Kalanchoe latent virus]